MGAASSAVGAAWLSFSGGAGSSSTADFHPSAAGGAVVTVLFEAHPPETLPDDLSQVLPQDEPHDGAGLQPEVQEDGRDEPQELTAGAQLLEQECVTSPQDEPHEWR
ncbi:MAG: hypothetical protein MK102_13280 [Fuerstiella sp.]|nr:hypothetical protein [Fuerstiella sp.]